jgi:uncharacterized membrane protein
VTNAARTLVAVAVLAVVVALVVALAGAVVYGATLRDTKTRLQPIEAPTVSRVRG